MSELWTPDQGNPNPRRPAAPRELPNPADNPLQIDAASGLAVPRALATRKRELITRDEWKLLDRTIQKVLGPRGLKFMLLCNEKGCPGRLIRKQPLGDGGFSLQCGCRDRVYHPSI